MTLSGSFKREVERARKKDVLVVAPKAVLHKLYEDIRGKPSMTSQASLRCFMALTVRWFGPRFTGHKHL